MLERAWLVQLWERPLGHSVLLQVQAAPGDGIGITLTPGLPLGCFLQLPSDGNSVIYIYHSTKLLKSLHSALIFLFINMSISSTH